MKKSIAMVTTIVLLLGNSVAFATEPDWDAIDEEHNSSIIHEPTVGVYYGSYNDDKYRAWGIYAEYLAWIRVNGFDLGVGAFGMYSEGESTESSYTGKEYRIGPQFGVQRTYANDEGELRQFQFKLRPVFWHGEGSTDEGYWKEQENFLLGLYLEYVAALDEDWKAGVTFDAWLDLFSPSHFASSWSGDSPEDRTVARLYAFAQYQLNDHLATRGGAGPFYSGWDAAYGFGAFLELRVWEMFMFGPSVGWMDGTFSCAIGARAELGDWLQKRRSISYFDAINKTNERPEVKAKQN